MISIELSDEEIQDLKENGFCGVVAYPSGLVVGSKVGSYFKGEFKDKSYVILRLRAFHKRPNKVGEMVFVFERVGLMVSVFINIQKKQYYFSTAHETESNKSKGFGHIVSISSTDSDKITLKEDLMKFVKDSLIYGFTEIPNPDPKFQL